jgi:hypothetical protein
MAELKKIVALVNSANNQLFMSLKTGTFTSINIIYYMYILVHLFYINLFCVTLEHTGVLKLTELNINNLTYMTTGNTDYGL